MKKKYLFICGELNAGGGERVLVDMLRNFDYSQYEVDLLQINGGGILTEQVPTDVNIYEAWHGYPLFYKLVSRLQHYFGILYFYKKQLLKTLSSKTYDVAISFLEGTPLLAHSLIVDFADRNYSWVHCDLYISHYEEDLFRIGEELQSYNKMNAVICVANGTASAFRKRFPNCSSNTMVIYNPIDVNKIRRMSLENVCDNPQFTIAVLGRLSEGKKIDRAVRLCRKLIDNSFKVRIQIIGDGDQRQHLELLARTLNVTPYIEFCGYKDNPYPLLLASDMLLSTSDYEGFSLVVCEAMALGVPVVATKTAGPMEILDNDKYGLLCEHDDESIYQAVKQMYEYTELRKHYSEVGKERVKDFSVDKAMKAIYQL